MSMMIGRAYLDPGDRLSGRHDPPMPVTVLLGWGAARGTFDLPAGLTVQMYRCSRADRRPVLVRDSTGALVVFDGMQGAGPRNVLIRRADGTLAVVPFPRRLRVTG